MADDMPSPPAPAPSPRKRPAPAHESPRRVALNTRGSQFRMPTPPAAEESSSASPDGSSHTDDRKRAASPALSCSTIASSVDGAPSNAVPDPRPATAAQSTAPACPSTSGPTPAKRRKLTPSEKLEQTRAKEAKARGVAEKKALAEQKKALAEQKRALAEQKKADAAAEKAKKAEQRARKEEEKAEEKAQKDEERRAKDEEKRAKAEEKEARKREKELEEERKAQEKLAKERRQMRLGAFFGGKPPTGSKDGGDDPSRTRRKSLSLEPFDAGADKTALPVRGTPPSSARKTAVSDYKRTFLPFELPPTGSLAPLPHYSDADQDRFDRELNDPSIQEKYDLGLVDSYASLSNYFEPGCSIERGRQFPDIEQVVEHLKGISRQPIDLTGAVVVDPGADMSELGVQILNRVPIKHICFHEDVRPAYVGSYTQIRSPRQVRKTRRNPFTKARPDTDYDVDSEAEWEEPEEGDEEILDDDEDEVDSQADADEMDDFLDDEDDVKNKRKLITDSLVPDNTGLCWENDVGTISVVDSIEVDVQPEALAGMQIGFLLPGFSGQTIDPFSTTYWEKPAPVPTQAVVALVADAPASSGTMAPPRQPLPPKSNFSATQPRHDVIGAAKSHQGHVTSLVAIPAVKRGHKSASKTLDKEDLEEFKQAVNGNLSGKLDLLKGLKIRFPKLTNEAIKENLNALFAQKGTGKAKHWVYVGDS